MANMTRTIANRTIAKLTIGFVALATLAAVGTTLIIQSAPHAKAAPIVNAAAPLTISRKPARDLAPGPGIRLAKVSSNDGGNCFRASRFLADQGRTISETFCSH